MIEDKQNSKKQVKCTICGDMYYSRRKDRKYCDALECRKEEKKTEAK